MSGENNTQKKELYLVSLYVDVENDESKSIYISFSDDKNFYRCNISKEELFNLLQDRFKIINKEK